MTKIKCPVCEHTNDSARKDCIQCGAPLPKIRVQGPGAKSGNAPQPDAHAGGHSTFRKGQLVANRYTIIDLVGKGGMGCIYLVLDNTLKEQVALKTLLPQYLRDKMVVERFFNEARIARQLSHPNIVRVHDIGMADQVLYISMEYLPGKSLRNMLDELLPGERLPVKETLSIMIDLCTALEYAHQYTIHRDLKPENIMLQPDGTLKLMDFGISKLMTTGKMTATAVVMGTPHYMPPEQFRDSSTVDVRADIYSIGVILYEILTGNLPTGVPKPASQILRDVPPALDPIVAKCVEPNPDDRYANASELKQALSAVSDLLRGGTLDSRKLSKTSAMASGDVIRRAGGGLLIACVVLMTAVGIYGLEGRRAKQLAEASTIPAADPRASIDRQWHARYKNAEILIGVAERQTANRDQTGDSVKPIYDRIRVLRDAAAKAEEPEPERATKLAYQALQCYAALVNPLPEESYLFILPRDVDEDGFYIAAHPVTVREFTDWANRAQWRDMPYSDDPGQPIATRLFYDAQAYAAQQQMRIPSRSEWQRAFDARPDALVTEIPEWTRDIVSGDPDASDAPTFGYELDTVFIGLDEDGNPVPPTFRPMPYSAPGESIGFRCVVPISTDPEAMRIFFGA